MQCTDDVPIECNDGMWIFCRHGMLLECNDGILGCNGVVSMKYYDVSWTVRMMVYQRKVMMVHPRNAMIV